MKMLEYTGVKIKKVLGSANKCEKFAHPEAIQDSRKRWMIYYLYLVTMWLIHLDCIYTCSRMAGKCRMNRIDWSISEHTHRIAVVFFSALLSIKNVQMKTSIEMGLMRISVPSPTSFTLFLTEKFKIDLSTALLLPHQ